MLPAVKFAFVVCLFYVHLDSCVAWDNEELELFDLVEEVNANFYSVLGVEQTSSSADIRKAYRKLSLQLHPDKNKEEDAEIKFRQLVAVYDVLKNKERREQYNLVLEHGLPDWRQPVYYYRRVRKLGLLELAILLFFIFTVGHFLVIWAAYIEKRFVAEELFHDRKKKKEKKRKARLAAEAGRDDDLEGEMLREQLSYIPRPGIVDILPIKLSRGMVWMVCSVPRWVEEWREEKRQRLEEEEAERLMQLEIEEEIKAEKERVKRPRVRKRVDLPEKQEQDNDMAAPVTYTPVATAQEDQGNMQCVRSGEWTDEDYQMLSKACTRFPGGTVNRWEKMATFMNRPQKEVIKKAGEMKGGYGRTVSTAAQGITGAVDENSTQKRKATANPKDGMISTRDDEEEATATQQGSKKTKPPPKTADRTLLIQEAPSSANREEWTQNQQKIFEWGLSNFPKGTAERWEKISEHIPGKNKDDCIARFKYLADVVRKRKQQQSS